MSLWVFLREHGGHARRSRLVLNYRITSRSPDKKKTKYLATTSGSKGPAPSHIKAVSSGFVACSLANPGVFVSGGQLTETLMPNGLNSEKEKFEDQY